MGFGIRALVAVILALISLSVLSLHIALCFHYPSALFAVTLLLNPSLWLFVGILSMFCTLVLSFRDRRRKLVPAFCTSCRPKHEVPFNLTSRGRYYHRRWNQHTSCKCSERGMQACHYSSDSSVHTTTQLLSTDSGSSQVITQITESSIGSENEVNCEGNPLLSFDQNSNPRFLNQEERKNQTEDVQNYSCLMKPISEHKRSTFVVLDKDGRTRHLYYNPGNVKLPETHKSSNLEVSSQSTGDYSLCSVKSETELHKDSPILVNLEDVEQNSESSSISSHDTSSPCKIQNKQFQREYSTCLARTTAIKQGISCTQDRSCKPLIKNTCTCPRRYYKSRIPYITKSNKPIMKCTKTLRNNTPVHLFQTTGKEDDATQSRTDITPKLETKTKFQFHIRAVKKSSSFSDMTREPDTLSSIVSLLDS